MDVERVLLTYLLLPFRSTGNCVVIVWKMHSSGNNRTTVSSVKFFNRPQFCIPCLEWVWASFKKVFLHQVRRAEEMKTCSFPAHFHEGPPSSGHIQERDRRGPFSRVHTSPETVQISMYCFWTGVDTGKMSSMREHGPAANQIRSVNARTRYMTKRRNVNARTRPPRLRDFPVSYRIKTRCAEPVRVS